MTRQAVAVAKVEIPFAEISAGKIVSPVNSLVKIPLEMLRRFERQPRLHFSKQKLEELAGTIGPSGELEQPILVTLREEGRIALVIDGERRMRALHDKGFDHAPCLIKPPMSDKEVFLHSCIANFARENLSLLEMAQSIVDLQKEFGWNQSEVARAIGRSSGHVSQVLKVLNLHPDIQQLVLESKVNNNIALHIATYPKEDQLGLLRNLMSKKAGDKDKPPSSSEAARKVKKLAEKRGIHPRARVNQAKQRTYVQLLMSLIIRTCDKLTDALEDLKKEKAWVITGQTQPPFQMVKERLEEVFGLAKEELERLTKV